MPITCQSSPKDELTLCQEPRTGVSLIASNEWHIEWTLVSYKRATEMVCVRVCKVMERSVPLSWSLIWNHFHIISLPAQFGDRLLYMNIFKGLHNKVTVSCRWLPRENLSTNIFSGVVLRRNYFSSTITPSFIALLVDFSICKLTGCMLLPLEILEG